MCSGASPSPFQLPFSVDQGEAVGDVLGVMGSGGLIAHALVCPSSHVQRVVSLSCFYVLVKVLPYRH